MPERLLPDEARCLLRVGLRMLALERRLTARVIEAVPIDRGDYRPEPVARTALDLAWHIVGSEMMLLDGLSAGAIVYDWKRPPDVETSADVVAWYNPRFQRVYDRLRGLSVEQLVTPLPFKGLRRPAVMYIQTAIRHSVHHRGQLSVYLRPMGATVPPIYGDSADEGWGDVVTRMFGSSRRRAADDQEQAQEQEST